MSQGGSSLVANWVIVALLLIVSHHARKPIATVAAIDADSETTQLVKVPALRSSA
jgi:hypothetical protein